MAARIKKDEVKEVTNEEMAEEATEMIDGALLAKATEIIHNSRVIVEDTKVNRAEYNSKDLSYRAIELLLVVLDCFSIVLKVAERQIIVNGSDDEN